MELYVVRHGKTIWNDLRKLQGIADIQLNERGIADAKALGKSLMDTHFDAIYSSPLARAKKTAELIRNGRDIPIICDQRLIEINFGNYEGKIFEYLLENTSFKAFFDDPEHYIPPENGESFPSVLERTKNFLTEVIEKQKENGRYMVVAHGALNAALTSNLEKRPLSQYWGKGLQKNCEAIIYTKDGLEWKRKE